MNIVTADTTGQIQVYSPSENKVVETFAPEGMPTCIRVFEQFTGILFMCLSRQAPDGSTVGCISAISGENRIEVEAHASDITDMI